MCQWFGHCFLNFFVSVHDLLVIANALNTCNLMPQVGTLDELQTLPASIRVQLVSLSYIPAQPPGPAHVPSAAYVWRAIRGGEKL
jgi:hypothetical protein